ncbi:ORF083L [Infectious spleen and kidney necrosis virus]|uniref:ORF083L n=1 Tax=Infectious spleen and kidney necrosis virus (isolate Mandarin fish/China/Nanhai/1998) TaxID=654923 RepID=Q8QUM7_ISKNN|nr:ORF083L [Infectious spleen and kidney necrosis virus]AAL98807.1 ORF083L [Infectious spleen and kidney necrosis virus]
MAQSIFLDLTCVNTPSMARITSFLVKTLGSGSASTTSSNAAWNAAMCATD